MGRNPTGRQGRPIAAGPARFWPARSRRSPTRSLYASLTVTTRRACRLSMRRAYGRRRAACCRRRFDRRRDPRRADRGQEALTEGVRLGPEPRKARNLRVGKKARARGIVHERTRRRPRSTGAAPALRTGSRGVAPARGSHAPGSRPRNGHPGCQRRSGMWRVLGERMRALEKCSFPAPASKAR